MKKYPMNARSELLVKKVFVYGFTWREVEDFFLMNRNLLYTAVTRARKCVTLVGDDTVFNQMIDNIVEQKRYTALAERICELSEGGE